jgi:hypothetical protein
MRDFGLGRGGRDCDRVVMGENTNQLTVEIMYPVEPLGRQTPPGWVPIKILDMVVLTLNAGEVGLSARVLKTSNPWVF